MSILELIPSEQRKKALIATCKDNEPIMISGPAGVGKMALAHWIYKNSHNSSQGSFWVANAHQDISLQLQSLESGFFVVPSFDTCLSSSSQLKLLNILRSRSFTMYSDRLQTPYTQVCPSIRVVLLAETFSEYHRHILSLPWGLSQRKTAYHDLYIDSLKHRKSELTDIVQKILYHLTRSLNKTHVRTLSPLAWEKVLDHSWEGNLKELRTYLWKAVNNTQGSQIHAENLPEAAATSSTVALHQSLTKTYKKSSLYYMH